jgi:hypothetical protein
MFQRLNSVSVFRQNPSAEIGPEVRPCRNQTAWWTVLTEYYSPFLSHFRERLGTEHNIQTCFLGLVCMKPRNVAKYTFSNTYRQFQENHWNSYWMEKTFSCTPPASAVWQYTTYPQGICHCHPSRCTQPHTPWVPEALSIWLKWQGCNNDHASI